MLSTTPVIISVKFPKIFLKKEKVIDTHKEDQASLTDSGTTGTGLDFNPFNSFSFTYRKKGPAKVFKVFSLKLTHRPFSSQLHVCAHTHTHRHRKPFMSFSSLKQMLYPIGKYFFSIQSHLNGTLIVCIYVCHANQLLFLSHEVYRVIVYHN